MPSATEMMQQGVLGRVQPLQFEEDASTSEREQIEDYTTVTFRTKVVPEYPYPMLRVIPTESSSAITTRRVFLPAVAAVTHAIAVAHMGAEALFRGAINSQTAEELYPQTSKLFVSLVNAPSKDINKIFTRILETMSPAEVLDAGLREYRHTGRERYLSITVSLLEDFGMRGWPALRQLAESGLPETESFVPLIASFREVPIEERRSVARHLARSPHTNVKLALLESLEESSENETVEILKLLAYDTDERIKERAKEYLEFRQE